MAWIRPAPVQGPDQLQPQIAGQDRRTVVDRLPPLVGVTVVVLAALRLLHVERLRRWEGLARTEELSVMRGSGQAFRAGQGEGTERGFQPVNGGAMAQSTCGDGPLANARRVDLSARRPRAGSQDQSGHQRAQTAAARGGARAEGSHEANGHSRGARRHGRSYLHRGSAHVWS
jgi:hypothetical protein